MRANQFDISLSDAVPASRRSTRGSMRWAIPFFFKDDAEATAVRDALTPMLEKRIAAKAFHPAGVDPRGLGVSFRRSR
jgi:hypothetical protein